MKYQNFVRWICPLLLFAFWNAYGVAAFGDDAAYGDDADASLLASADELITVYASEEDERDDDAAADDADDAREDDGPPAAGERPPLRRRPPNDDLRGRGPRRARPDWDGDRPRFRDSERRFGEGPGPRGPRGEHRPRWDGPPAPGEDQPDGFPPRRMGRPGPEEFGRRGPQRPPRGRGDWDGPRHPGPPPFADRRPGGRYRDSDDAERPRPMNEIRELRAELRELRLAIEALTRQLQDD